MKKSTHKRLTAWLLTLALVVTLLPGMGMTALAVEDGDEGNGPPAVEVVEPEDESSGSDETVGTPPPTESEIPAPPESKEEDKNTENEGDPSGSDYDIEADTQPRGLMRALAAPTAADYPGPTYVSVNGGTDFKADKLYFRNGETQCSANPANYNAHYDPTTGTLTLDGYNGGAIELGEAVQGDLTIKLMGNNTIHSTTSRHGVAGSTASSSITITADSSSNGKLTIDVSNSTDYVYGIDGIQRSVTITGSADVTIIAEAKSTDKLCFGINSLATVSILDNASVNITSKVPENNTGSNFCRGINGKKVAIDTDGTIMIDVTAAGDAGADSYGVDTTSSTILTKVGEMQVKWKKDTTTPVGGTTIHVGGAISRGDSFDINTHAVNVDKDNCFASYRHGTPRTVTVENGTFTGPGVPNATKYSGKFLENDTVTIKPSEKKSSDGTLIPFKEWTSSNVTLSDQATMASNSFTVPGEDVTVTAKHSPFVGTPTFTPTDSTGTEGTLTFKTVVKPGDGSEYFSLVKDGDQNNESNYKRLRRMDTPSSASPYEYSRKTTPSGTDQVEAGDYYVAEKLNGAWYLSEKFTVNYVKPRPEIHTDWWFNPMVFTSVDVGYVSATGLNLTITNKGEADTGELTITVEGKNPDAFTVSKEVINNIPAGGNAMSTVRPKTGLTAGTYTATLKISGANVNTLSYNMEFTVKDPNASATVSGTIKSYGSASEAVTVTLLQGTSEVATKTLTGASGTVPYSQSYAFPAVPAGTYTLKVEKKGHAPWTEEITVDSTAIAKDVTVYLWGDVNRDGEVTAADAQEIQRNAAGLSSVFDTDPNSAYCTLRADVNRDGAITAADAQEIQRKAAGLSSTISTLP